MTVCLVVPLSEGLGCHHILTRACHALGRAAPAKRIPFFMPCDCDMYVSKQVPMTTAVQSWSGTALMGPLMS